MELRAENVSALVDALDQGFGAQSMAELERRFRLADLVWAPVQTPADLVEDAQVQAVGCFEEALDQNGDAYQTIAGPIDFALPPAAHRVPAQGEHTAEVVAAAGGGWPVAGERSKPALQGQTG